MKDEEREEHMIIAKIAYCLAVIELKRNMSMEVNHFETRWNYWGPGD